MESEYILAVHRGGSRVRPLTEFAMLLRIEHLATLPISSCYSHPVLSGNEILS